jgi:transposase-like protein
MSSVHAGDPSECPRCHHGHVVRKGRDGKGRQRWLCRGCGRTFGASTLGLLAQSKLGPGVWASYVEHMVEGESLQRCADLCGVCLRTSWFMRMRVCEVMRSRLLPARAGTFHVDELLVTENISGKHPSEGPRSMPRKAHRNGRDGRRKECGRMQKIVVSCGVNELGDCFCRLVGRGKPGRDQVRAAIEGVPLAGASVSTDWCSAYLTPLREAGVLAHRRYLAKEAGEGELGAVNSLHSRLSTFLAPFNGVSTRRLQRYLDWFCWEEQARRSPSTRGALLAPQVAGGSYSVRRAALIDEGQPFWDHWEGKHWCPEEELEWLEDVSIVV